MQLTEHDVILVTGGTGLVGSHVVEMLRGRGLTTRALVRAGSDASLLQQWGAEVVTGDLADTETLTDQAFVGVTHIVHCAAKVGDWGPTEDYRTVNVRGLEHLLKLAEANGTLRRFVQISSLGVYPARDHYGTDESEQPSTAGIDGYTLTKVEAENLVRDHIANQGLPGVVLRPGFIYGPRDRTVLPRLMEKIASKQFRYLGSGEKLMNNTFVGNLVQAILLALESDDVVGEVFNITDGRLVTKREFVSTIAAEAGLDVPTRKVPLPVAKTLAKLMEGTWKLLRKKEAPLLSNARIKFLGLNLDYSIGKARRELGYEPATEFQAAMKQTIGWFRGQQSDAA